MKRKITTTLLILITLVLILPMAAQALPDLVVNAARIAWRNGPLDYTIKYQLRNIGPDDLEDATFYDAAYYKESGKWYIIPSSIIIHVNYDLGASENSEWFYWRSDMPSGWTWWCQCTDIYDDVEEENEENNCKLKLDLFI